MSKPPRDPRRQQWYAARVTEYGRPYIFATYEAAVANATVDEAIYLVTVDNLRCLKKSQRIQPKPSEVSG